MQKIYVCWTKHEDIIFVSFSKPVARDYFPMSLYTILACTAGPFCESAKSKLPSLKYSKKPS